MADHVRLSCINIGCALLVGQTVLFDCALLLFAFVSFGSEAHAQFDYDSGQDTVFQHSETLPWWLSGQGNFIFQWHPSFHADYSGPNSFEHASEQAASEVVTLYGGLQMSPTMEALVDVESAGGSGLSQTLGLAGFVNADAVRSPNLGAEPYLARLEYHKVIPLSDDTSMSSARRSRS